MHVSIGLIIIVALFVSTIGYVEGARRSRGSYRSSRSSSSSRRRSSRTRRASSSVIAGSTILIGTDYYGYGAATYRRYDDADPEYCVACNRSTTNDTCEAEKLLCQQSSDCYTLAYTEGNGSTNASFVDKGCLYDPYGADGCAEQLEDCEDEGNDECVCYYCETGYCNSINYRMERNNTNATKIAVGTVVAVAVFIIFLWYFRKQMM